MFQGIFSLEGREAGFAAMLEEIWRLFITIGVHFERALLKILSFAHVTGPLCVLFSASLGEDVLEAN